MRVNGFWQIIFYAGSNSSSNTAAPSHTAAHQTKRTAEGQPRTQADSDGVSIAGSPLTVPRGELFRDAEIAHGPIWATGLGSLQPCHKGTILTALVVTAEMTATPTSSRPIARALTITDTGWIAPRSIVAKY